MNLVLVWWMAKGAIAQQPGRWILSLAAVAFGVALGTAIHTVNFSALSEFNRSLAVVNGLADAMVVPKSGALDEALVGELEKLNHDRPMEKTSELFVSSRLELTTGLAHDKRSLTLQGIDLFRVAMVTPSVLPSALPASDDSSTQNSRENGFGLFDADSIFLSRQHLAVLARKPGEFIELSYQGNVHRLRIAGFTTTSDEHQGNLRAVMDMEQMQRRFGLTGKLSRIDLKLGQDWHLHDIENFIAKGQYKQQVMVVSAQAQQERASNLSRAYRINLNVLALVALFTGAFLVFSSVNLTATAQRSRFGLLSCLGASQAQTRLTLLFQGGLIGFLGGLIGIALGLGLAKILLSLVGGDLGSGYFASTSSPVQVDWPVLTLFLAGSLAVGLLAAWLPASQIANSHPIESLRGLAGFASIETKLSASLLPLGLALVAGVFLILPPVDGLPWLAYIAIAFILIAGIMATPWIVRLWTKVLARFIQVRVWKHPALWLAWQKVSRSPTAATAVIAGIVASFALTVAMSTMVHSLRDAVTLWLDRVLPAELYVRGPIGGMNASQLEVLLGLAEVKAEFLRIRELQLDASKGSVALVAREFDHKDVSKTTPLKGSITPSPDKTFVPIYISEAMQALYGWQPGQVVELPLERPARFHISGIWRDYARQTGAIMIELSDYQALTDDKIVNDAALHLAKPMPAAESAATWTRTRTSLQDKLPDLQLRSAQEIRSLSLSIFDRSFSVTYVLEVAALLIGVVGLGSAFSAQIMARQQEFGMLLQLGVSDRDVLWQLALEGMLVCVIGLSTGIVLGLIVACILVFKVNPESFHWTMPLTIPWENISTMSLVLLLSAAIAAVLSARRIVNTLAIQSVRVDS